MLSTNNGKSEYFNNNGNNTGDILTKKRNIIPLDIVYKDFEGHTNETQKDKQSYSKE